MGLRPRSHHLDDSDIHPQIQDLQGELEHAQNLILEIINFQFLQQQMNYWAFGTMNNIRDDVTMNINHKLECSEKKLKKFLCEELKQQ